MSSRITVALVLALLMGSVGCQSSHVDKHWGEAYRTAVARQTADPEGSAANADGAGPQGLDGGTANDVMGKYHTSQRKGGSQPKSTLKTMNANQSGTGR